MFKKESPVEYYKSKIISEDDALVTNWFKHVFQRQHSLNGAIETGDEMAVVSAPTNADIP